MNQKNKCFQMTMSCLQKKEEEEEKKEKPAEIHLLQCEQKKKRRIWSRLQSSIDPAAMRSPSVQSGHKYSPYEPTKSSFSTLRFRDTHFRVNIWSRVFEEGGGLANVCFRALWWPTAAGGDNQGDPKQACQEHCYRKRKKTHWQTCVMLWFKQGDNKEMVHAQSY